MTSEFLNPTPDWAAADSSGPRAHDRPDGWSVLPGGAVGHRPTEASQKYHGGAAMKQEHLVNTPGRGGEQHWGSTDPERRYVLGAAELILPRCGPSGGPGPSAMAPSTYRFPGPRTNRIGSRNLRNRRSLDPLRQAALPEDGATGERSVSGWWLA